MHEQFPDELLLHIFSFFPIIQLKVIRRVNKRFMHLVNLIIFKKPNFKKHLKLDISELLGLPIVTINTNFLARFIDIVELPCTVNKVIVSERRPIFPPKLILRYPSVDFYISTAYLHPANVFHLTNYMRLKNVKLFSSAFALRPQILGRFLDFNFQYINTSHLDEGGSKTSTAVEEGVLILSQLKVQRLVLGKSTWFSITVNQLSQLRNIVYIDSSVLAYGDGPFPLGAVLNIPTLEIIFFEKGVLYRREEFDAIKSLKVNYYCYEFLENGLARFASPCIIILKQPRCLFGKLYKVTGRWIRQIFQLYLSPGFPV